jgi:hypothetical protein
MNGQAPSPSLSKCRMKYQVSRTKRRINEDIVGALLAGGSIGAAERAETKCRLLINHLQEVWVYKKYGLEQKVQTCTQTFRTNLALEKGRSCVKSGRRGSWRYANFGRWSTSEAALTANHLQEVWVREQKVQTCTQSFRTNLALEKGRSCVKVAEGDRGDAQTLGGGAPAKQPSML